MDLFSEFLAREAKAKASRNRAAHTAALEARIAELEAETARRRAYDQRMAQLMSDAQAHLEALEASGFGAGQS